MGTRFDGELLRVVAHAVLSRIDQLVTEGLDRTAVDRLTSHALALTSTTVDLTGLPDRQRIHGLGLWDPLAALSGPVSATLLHWLDDALGQKP